MVTIENTFATDDTFPIVTFENLFPLKTFSLLGWEFPNLHRHAVKGFADLTRCARSHFFVSPFDLIR